MSPYQATREAAYARFFQEVHEATSDAERGRVILSLIEVAHQPEYARFMQQVVRSLLDSY
jgi:hypothetical protein